MAITAVKPSARLLAFLMVSVLTGCGLTQTVKDGAVSVTQSIFYPPGENPASGSSRPGRRE